METNLYDDAFKKGAACVVPTQVKTVEKKIIKVNNSKIFFELLLQNLSVKKFFSLHYRNNWKCWKKLKVLIIFLIF